MLILKVFVLLMAFIGAVVITYGVFDLLAMLVGIIKEHWDGQA